MQLNEGMNDRQVMMQARVWVLGGVCLKPGNESLLGGLA